MPDLDFYSISILLMKKEGDTEKEERKENEIKANKLYEEKAHLETIKKQQKRINELVNTNKMQEKK